MGKAIMAFVLLFALFFVGIELFRKLSGKEKWVLTKTVAYSIVCAVLAIVALTVIVLLF